MNPGFVIVSVSRFDAHLIALSSATVFPKQDALLTGFHPFEVPDRRNY